MQKILLLFFIFTANCQLPTVTCFSQNLVPNPSFEDYSTCPDNENQVEYATGWSNFSRFGLTPDYHNSCSTNPWFSVPYNWGGYQQVVSGNAYCALGSNFGPSGDSVPREFIGAMLSEPLETGTKYSISFKTALAINENPDYWNCASNKLGVLFSTVIYNENNPINFKNFAHIYSDSVITDTMNWTLISGSFISDSAYKYIIVGNFFDNSNTDALKIYERQFNPTYCAAYYYVDDIIVEKDTVVNDTTDIDNTDLEQNFISIFPNPFSQRTYLTTDIDENIEINIFDIYGRIVKTMNSIGNKKIEIVRDNFPIGIYFLSINYNKKSYKQKIIITD